MYGIVSFIHDSGDVTEVEAVEAIPGEEPDLIRLTAEDRVEDPLEEAESKVEVGVAYPQAVPSDEIGVRCVYYDLKTGKWWTEEAGTLDTTQVV